MYVRLAAGTGINLCLLQLLHDGVLKTPEGVPQGGTADRVGRVRSARSQQRPESEATFEDLDPCGGRSRRPVVGKEFHLAQRCLGRHQLVVQDLIAVRRNPFLF